MAPVSDYYDDGPLCDFPCIVCQPWAFDENGDELSKDEIWVKWEERGEQEY